VRANFGQRPFKFDFVSTLGSDVSGRCMWSRSVTSSFHCHSRSQYLSNLERDKAKASQLTAVERQRRARAENLVRLGGGVCVCVIGVA
jgi:hypothetical protein